MGSNDAEECQMRTSFLLVGVAILAVTACSQSTVDGVASLRDSEQTVGTQARTAEDAVLEFSSCLRDNGVADFQDPVINPDGSLEWLSGKSDGDDGKESDGDDEKELGSAFEACGHLLDGTAFGKTLDTDDSPKLDALYEFAVCMRDNGYDMSDPDPQTGGFEGLERKDSAFEQAYEVCGDQLGSKDGK
jgi:hypothetical protein